MVRVSLKVVNCQTLLICRTIVFCYFSDLSYIYFKTLFKLCLDLCDLMMFYGVVNPCEGKVNLIDNLNLICRRNTDVLASITTIEAPLTCLMLLNNLQGFW